MAPTDRRRAVTCLHASVTMKRSCCCCCCCCNSCLYHCRTADSSSLLSKKLRLRTLGRIRSNTGSGWGDTGESSQVKGVNNRICHQIYKELRGGLGPCRTLLCRTPPPSWTALSCPAEADTDASSWFAASRCAELSAAPMANNHASKLFLP